MNSNDGFIMVKRLHQGNSYQVKEQKKKFMSILMLLWTKGQTFIRERLQGLLSVILLLTKSNEEVFDLAKLVSLK